MSADAGEALKVVTGSSRFEASAEEYTVAQAATDLVDALTVPTVPKAVCRVCRTALRRAPRPRIAPR
ncbi:hypothetical protein [Streptomyces sp. UH6]|uniref:hypothetical protein n=1 Tax=Streptomyces sp. UH6 TaxID=2748379 RepID=UPI0015D5023B|nr:hypothetical protein [Streptomyces sp. UH6]